VALFIIMDSHFIYIFADNKKVAIDFTSILNQISQLRRFVSFLFPLSRRDEEDCDDISAFISLVGSSKAEPSCGHTFVVQ
jgi:hypothetical protein